MLLLLYKSFQGASNYHQIIVTTMETPRPRQRELFWPSKIINQQNTSSPSFRRSSSIISTLASNPSAALEEALLKITTAVAHFRRAGPFYSLRSEAYWIFVAGSWGREEFEERLRVALGKEKVSAYGTEGGSMC